MPQPFVLASGGLLVVCVVLWAMALNRTNTQNLGEWGLLPVFPVTWYVAVALTLGVCLAGILRKAPNRLIMAAAVTALNVMLYASPNLVETAPRLPWVYKHIAVVRYIEANGSVNPSIDLYNRWPGFFSLNGFLGELIGYDDPVKYAGLAEVGFALVDVLLVVAISRTISRRPAFYWTAGLVFTLGDWVGQNYFAPQAFAFTLYLVIALILLKFLRRRPRKLAAAIERIVARVLRRPRGVPDESMVSAGSKRLQTKAIAAVLVLQAIIVASHQLTPYLALLALVPLMVLGYFKNIWVGLAMAAITIGYLVPNLPYVEKNYGLFSGFDPVANATYSPVDRAQLSVAAIWQGRGVLVLTAITVTLALAGFVRHLWQGYIGTTLVVMWLAVAPVLTLLGQTYGGEGKFRVILFGLPWYAIGVAWFFFSARSTSRSRWLRSGWVATMTLMAVLLVATSYQPEADYQVPASEVDASEWLDGQLQPGNSVITSVGAFPTLIGSNYYVLARNGSLSALSDAAQYFPTGGITAADIEQLIANAGTGTQSAYVVFSDSEEKYAVEHGLFTAVQLRTIEAQVRGNTAFTLAYNNGAVRIYKFQ